MRLRLPPTMAEASKYISPDLLPGLTVKSVMRLFRDREAEGEAQIWLSLPVVTRCA